MKRRYKWIIALLFVLLLSVAARGCAAPLWYSSPALEARVVDAATGQPLEGVIAVAHWELRGGFFHGATTGQLLVLETMTNADGQFAFAAWGPKLRPWGGALEELGSPNLVLFKSGYNPAYLYPKELAGMARAPRILPRPEWHRTTIQLKKSDDNVKESVKQLNLLQGQIERAFKSDGYAWRQIPRLRNAIAWEDERLEKEKKMSSGTAPIDQRP